MVQVTVCYIAIYAEGRGLYPTPQGLTWTMNFIFIFSQIPMFVAILFVKIIKLTLIVVTLITSYERALIGVGIACTSFPVYFIFIYWKSRPKWMIKAYGESILTFLYTLMPPIH